MDTKPPDGEAQLAKDMTVAEFRIAKVRTIREAAERQRKADDQADLDKVIARHAKKDAKP